MEAEPKYSMPRYAIETQDAIVQRRKKQDHQLSIKLSSQAEWLLSVDSSSFCPAGEARMVAVLVLTVSA